MGSLLTQPKLCILVYFTWSLTRLCESSSTCPIFTRVFSFHTGLSTRGQCNTISGDTIFCSLSCGKQPLCKLVYVTNCDTSGQCTCIYCNQLLGVDFSIINVHFYLQTQEIGADTSRVDLLGGLIVGQPLLIKVTLEDSTVNLNFMSSATEGPFMTEISFDKRAVSSRWRQGWFWGQTDSSMPYFNFTIGQELSIFCVVTPTYYDLYFDKILFKRFFHKLSIGNVKYFEVSGRMGQSKIVSLHR